MADSWDEGGSTAVITPATGNNTGAFGGGINLGGRGRGFGNISAMANNLPKPGGDVNGAADDCGWDESATPNSSTWSNNSNNNTWGSKKFDSDAEAPRGGGSRGGGRSNACFKCGQEGHMSRDCMNQSSNNRGGGGKGACFKCGEEGHMSRECPNPSSNNRGGGKGACFKCGATGHMSRECTSSASNNRGGGKGACFKCGEEGHMSRECPNPSSNNRGGADGKGACFKCGEEGHMSRDCTNPSSNRGRECRNCGEEGHMSRDCPTAEKKSNACFKCGEDGHMSRDCPNSEKKPSGCFNCGEEGHMSKECPNPSKNVGPDGKPRSTYVPPEPTDDEGSMFEGVPTGINFDRYDNIKVNLSGDKPPRPIETFAQANFRPLLNQNIEKSKYTKPTPIQKHAMPIILAKRDLMACAQTGSGKTAAFLLPMLQAMFEDSNLPNNTDCETQEPWAVVISPTRELAIQIYNEARKFSLGSIVKCALIYGGTAVGVQLQRLSRGCHILVATPGRLLDFVEKGKVSFSQLHYLVLDEADRMLDMGFVPEVRRMVGNASMPDKSQRQTLMFSATFPSEIQMLAKDFLVDDYLFLAVGIVGAANEDVKQTIFQVGQFDKKEKLVDILKDSGLDRTLVFVEKKRTADFLASFLSQASFLSTSIHGDRQQKEREEALDDFRRGRMPILVATAVAARGLDIKDVRHVVNYDLPEKIDEYVHRIGRTGRVGNVGTATSFFDPSCDGPLAGNLVKILADAHQDVPEWLEEAAGGGYSQNGGGRRFGSRDIRKDAQSYSGGWENDSQPQGGFSAQPDADEAWD